MNSCRVIPNDTFTEFSKNYCGGIQREQLLPRRQFLWTESFALIHGRFRDARWVHKRRRQTYLSGEFH